MYFLGEQSRSRVDCFQGFIATNINFEKGSFVGSEADFIEVVESIIKHEKNINTVDIRVKVQYENGEAKVFGASQAKEFCRHAITALDEFNSLKKSLTPWKYKILEFILYKNTKLHDKTRETILTNLTSILKLKVLGTVVSLEEIYKLIKQMDIFKDKNTKFSGIATALLILPNLQDKHFHLKGVTSVQIGYQEVDLVVEFTTLKT